MASEAFEVEDQTDEDFFDKLVNDDDGINFAGYVPSLVKADDFVEAKEVSLLSIGEVGPARVDYIGDFSFSADELEGGEDGGILTASKDCEGGAVVTERDAVISSSLNESGEAGLGEEGSLDDCARDDSGVGTGMGEKHIQSFNSDLNVDGASRFRSYSDVFNEPGDDSVDPFADLGNTDNLAAEFRSKMGVSENAVADMGSCSNQATQNHWQNAEHNMDAKDLNNSQYGENFYPGWRYEPNTGLWYQLDEYEADLSATTNHNSGKSVDENHQSDSVSGQRSNVYHLQQTAQSKSILGSVTEAATDVSLSNWNQNSPGTAEYPARMVFDPQYPGWYYDTIVQEWRLLESSASAIKQSTTSTYNHQFQNSNIDNYGTHVDGSQDHVMSWGGSMSDYIKKDTNMWQAHSVDKRKTIEFINNKQLDNLFGSAVHINNSAELQTEFRPSGTVAPFKPSSQNVGSSDGISGFQNFMLSQQFPQQHYQTKMEPNQHTNFEPAFFNSYTPVGFQQQQLQSGSQFSYAPREGRSSAGRPPHALITFGFGGQVVFLKNNGPYGSKDSLGGVVNVLNMVELFMEKTAALSFGLGACDYFQALCQQSFPGPLVGGNVGNKELNKWIDEKIANCEYSNIYYRKGGVMRLLFSLLKISYQYYGKLRSPFGTDPTLMETDCPESAVAKLLWSSKQNDVQVGENAALAHCLQNLPTEAQIQATALELQNLLAAGRKLEALQCAKEGYLWGPALVLASQLGNQFYGDTVKQMAVKQFVAGSPLQTLCLLIARQPADVFSSDTTSGLIPGSANTFQHPVQIGVNFMLDKWEENLAIITANRTKGDELVITHLGDCLWKERGEVAAAHACYLVAESDFEPYSVTARLCLIGADHWKSPRTYASPQAIQRTELYEYAKMLGNSQFVLLPFQPYKIVYAHMLAEVGKVADSLKYCQAILKSLKTGRAPEVDSWKQLTLSLEERLRVHQQSGYTTNLTPTKLVGKLLTFFDSTTNCVAGSLPPHVTLKSNSHFLHKEFSHLSGGLNESNSQSTMPMPSLMPSASVEPISEWTGVSCVTNQLSVPNSSSEFEFSRSPRKADSSKEADLSDRHEKASEPSRSSRFGRFGSQLFQKTLGLVLKSRPDRQAKLGEKNKFYYDEKLKRWVEEGAEPPAEDIALPPPPTFSAFQNATPNKNVNDAPITESFHTSSGPGNFSPSTSDMSPSIPPIPISSNQFSARGRMGVRSRYVDTFNKGSGTPTNLFPSPKPSSKTGMLSNPKFFVPTPVAPGEETVQATGEGIQESGVNNENPQTTTSSSSSPAVIMRRFPSMDNIVHKRAGMIGDGDNSFATHDRRASSWNGRLSDASCPMIRTADPPNQFSGSGNFGDASHEVEL